MLTLSARIEKAPLSRPYTSSGQHRRDAPGRGARERVQESWPCTHKGVGMVFLLS